MQKFDLIVIGTGIGLTLVDGAIKNNKTCAVIEYGKFGGTCLTKGCIPSKVLVAPADEIRAIKHAAKIGITIKNFNNIINIENSAFLNDQKANNEQKGQYEHTEHNEHNEHNEQKGQHEHNENNEYKEQIEQSANDNSRQFDSIVVDWPLISKRMWSQINISNDIENELLNTPNVTVFKGVAEFTGEKSLKIMEDSGEYSDEITSDIIILTPGARSFIPPVEGLETSGFITSETFFNEKFPEKLYKNLVILGAGSIGCEFAHIFSAMGAHVTLIEKKSKMLPLEENVVSDFVKKQFDSYGINVFLSTSLNKVSIDGKNKILHIKNDITNEEKEIVCDEIFVATGIRPNTDSLCLEKTLVKLDSRGWVVTDEYLKTSQDGIWALGDINGKFQFRHKANYEGEICLNNIFHPEKPKRRAEYINVPWAVFTCPQVAHVGMTQDEALAKNRKIFVGIKHYSSIAKGFAMGYDESDKDDGFVKLIVDENQKILGAHIVGPDASILIQSYVYLMNAGGSCIMKQSKNIFGTVQDIERVCTPSGSVDPITQSMVIHPALSELTAWVLEEMQLVEL